MQSCKKILLYGGSIVLIFAVVIFTTVVLWRLLLPFLFGILAAILLKPLSDFLVSKCKWKRVATDILLTLLLYGVLLALLIFVGYRITLESGSLLKGFLRDPVRYLENVTDKIGGIIRSNRFLARFQAVAWIREIASRALYSVVETLAGEFTEFIRGMISATPNGFLFLTSMILSSYYFLSLHDRLICAIRKFLPQKWIEGLSVLKKEIVIYFGSCLKATLILSGISFVILLAFFSALRLSAPFSTALLLTWIDLLPVLGVGTVLIPWGILTMLVGHIGRGILLIAVYLFIQLIRQLLLPRLLGKENGIPPLATIVAMYAGYRLIGIIGLILGPFIALLATAAVRVYLHLQASSNTEPTAAKGSPN